MNMGKAMTDDSLVFVHLSDIHFRCWSGSEYDVDSDLRNEILLDRPRIGNLCWGQVVATLSVESIKKSLPRIVIDFFI